LQGFVFFFFFNDTATTEIYTLSLHDALPICRQGKSLAMRFCVSVVIEKCVTSKAAAATASRIPPTKIRQG